MWRIGGGYVPTWTSAGKAAANSDASAAIRRTTSASSRNAVFRQVCQPSFFGSKPVLLVVEPASLCWLTGRMVKARDGVTWAEEFARLPALKAVVRDDGTGVGKGVRLDNARRREAGLAGFDQTLDVFHTLREGGRALRATWGVATRFLERA